MKIKDSVVFITGANRGLGLAFARAALAAGAKKVYAAARDPKSITLEGVHADRAGRDEARAGRGRRPRLRRRHAAHQQRRHLARLGPAVDGRRRSGARRVRHQLLRPLGPEPRLCAGAGEERRRRDRQRAVGAELDQPADRGHLQRVEVGRMVAEQWLAQRAARRRARRSPACTWPSWTPTWPAMCRATRPRPTTWRSRRWRRSKPASRKCWPMRRRARSSRASSPSPPAYAAAR